MVCRLQLHAGRPARATASGVPAAGHYAELLNTDGVRYGGSDVGNAGGVMSRAGPCARAAVLAAADPAAARRLI